MKIGDKIFYRLKDREYSRVEHGTILEETSRSWVTGWPDQWWARTPEGLKKHGTKIPKNGTVFYTEAEAVKINWALDHRWEIGDAVRNAAPDTLLRVADLLGITHPGVPESTPQK